MLHCSHQLDDVTRSVFLSLRPPFKGIGASTVAAIMEVGIHAAGLDTDQHTVKSFRPTGATSAIIEAGVGSHFVMKLGRWRNPDIFFNYYVHAETPVDYCYSSSLFDHNSSIGGLLF